MSKFRASEIGRAGQNRAHEPDGDRACPSQWTDTADLHERWRTSRGHRRPHQRGNARRNDRMQRQA